MRYSLTVRLLVIGTMCFITHANAQVEDSPLYSTSTPVQRIRIYRNLADLYIDTPKAKPYLIKMYNEASKIGDRKSMVEALNDIIVEEANNHASDSITKYTNYLRQIADAKDLNYLLPLYRMRLFDAQCFSYQKEEAIAKELKRHSSPQSKANIYEEIASTYNVGVSFYINGKYKESMPYFEKALKMAESLPGKERHLYQERILWKICYSYAQSGKEIEGIKMMENLINMIEHKYIAEYQEKRPFYKIDLYRLQYYSFMISSMPYLTLEQENYYWGQIQEIGKNLTNILDKYNYYLCAKNYYANNRTKKDLQKAIAADDSLIKFAKILAPQNLSALNQMNSQLYEENKDYLNALKYLKIAYHMLDSQNLGNAHKQLNELQVKYEVNELNKDKNQLEIENKQMQIIFLSVLLSFVIGVCTYLYYSLKRERRMKAELKTLSNKAQESEKMKQAFINSICHEIRTPLNAIVGFSDLIMNTDIDEETRQSFPAEIQKSTNLLTSLVNCMLEVASLDVSNDRLPCEPTDIGNICTQEMERITHKPGIEYRLDIIEENLLIPTNEHYLALVIEHLLSNANKFTEKGSITLGYRLNSERNEICICVTDTGYGIPKEKYEEVFFRFSKLDTYVPGSGLGLYLCRLVVKRLDGEIKIDPDYSEGTRMIVLLPIK